MYDRLCLDHVYLGYKSRHATVNSINLIPWRKINLFYCPKLYVAPRHNRATGNEYGVQTWVLSIYDDTLDRKK